MTEEERGLPFEGLTAEEKAAIEIVVSDVDDTITRNGKLYPNALQSLWKLKRMGKMVILLTGGSAGWADVYIRQWPVDAVIAESGAVILAHSKGGGIVYRFNPMIDPSFQKKKEELMKLTAGLRLSSDQFARLYDIAYEKSALSAQEARTLKGMVKAAGGHWTESSIHINVSFGSFGKRSSLIFFLDSLYDIKVDRLRRNGVYLGDSTNDDDLFGFMPLSIGMHSVEDSRDSFVNLPRYITEGYGGNGFSEFVRNLASDNS